MYSPQSLFSQGLRKLRAFTIPSATASDGESPWGAEALPVFPKTARLPFSAGKGGGIATRLQSVCTRRASRFTALTQSASPPHRERHPAFVPNHQIYGSCRANSRHSQPPGALRTHTCGARRNWRTELSADPRECARRGAIHPG